jgi:tetratricopeptide (TPR) repeat protein
MKLKLTIIAMIFIICSSASAQVYSTKYKATTIMQQEQFYLNGGSRIGGKPRTTIKIDLPENTVKWYYSFHSIANDEKLKMENQGLVTQLTKIAANPKFEISKVIIGSILTPTGSGVIDIYLSNYEGSQNFMKKSFGSYDYKDIGNYAEGSRQNIKQGVIDIDDIKTGSVYLCFRNPSGSQGVNVSLEVVAIVEEKTLDNNTWSQERQLAFYNAFFQNLKSSGMSESISKEVSGCLVEKLINAKTPQEWDNMNEGLRTTMGNELVQSCLEKYQPKKTGEEQKGTTFGNLGWKMYENGNIDKAIEHSKKALTFDKTLGYVKGNLGLFYLIKGDEATATDYYVDAISDFNRDKISAKQSLESAIKDIIIASKKYPEIKDYQSFKELLELELQKYK